jgi:WD repeat-containing protein 6
VFAVECGGSHRSWSYHYDVASNQHALVWTKASTFNYKRMQDQSPRIIQEGGHGREIKAVTVRPRTKMGSSNEFIIATGSEDTVIRLFVVDIQNNSFKPLLMLADHTTGVQHLAFSSSGKYLFSSGGNGQFMAWAINEGVPIFELGGFVLDSMTQHEHDRDARILSFDLVSETSDCFCFAIAYSNGKIRIVTYRPGPASGSGVFTTETSIVYGTFCLMQAQCICNNEFGTNILAAGTNGRLYMTGIEASSTTVTTATHAVHQSSIMAMDHRLLNDSLGFVATGGDDNAVGFTLLLKEAGEESLHSPEFRTILIPKAHAAAVTAVKVLEHVEIQGKYQLAIVSVGNDQRVKMWTVELPLRPSVSLEDVTVSKTYECWTCVADVSSLAMVGSANQSERNFLVVVVGVGMELLKLSLQPPLAAQ